MCCSRQQGSATAGHREVNKLGMETAPTVLNARCAKLAKICEQVDGWAVDQLCRRKCEQLSNRVDCESTNVSRVRTH